MAYAQLTNRAVPDQSLRALIGMGRGPDGIEPGFRALSQTVGGGGRRQDGRMEGAGWRHE